MDQTEDENEDSCSEPEIDPGGAHLLDIDGLDEYGPELSRPAGAPDSGLISKEMFWQSFRGLVSLPNIAVSPPLQSLVIADNDGHARQVSDKLYDICRKVSWLRWMVHPGGEWAQSAILIGSWAAGLSIAVRMELQERVNAAAKRGRASSPVPVSEDPPAKPDKPLPEVQLSGG